MSSRSVLTSAILAAVLVFGGLWALNNTVPGLNIKCRVLNDLGACLVLTLTQPARPPVTETPEERAAREAAEEQERLDTAVRNASSAVGRAIDDVNSNGDDLMTGAADMASAANGVRDSISDGMQSSYANLMERTQVRPMDDVAQGDVCVRLGDVEVRRGDVDVRVGDFEVAENLYRSAVSDRSAYISALQAAIADLNAAVAANPDGLAPGGSTAPYTAQDGEDALIQADQAPKSAASMAAKAKADLADLVVSADGWMTKARQLAATVASC